MKRFLLARRPSTLQFRIVVPLLLFATACLTSARHIQNIQASVAYSSSSLVRSHFVSVRCVGAATSYLWGIASFSVASVVGGCLGLRIRVEAGPERHSAPLSLQLLTFSSAIEVYTTPVQELSAMSSLRIWFLAL